MSLLEEALAAAAEESTPNVDVDVELAGKLLPLRFYRLDGERWAEICAFCPARPGSPIDEAYGYNFQDAARRAAVHSGRLIEDDAEVTLAATDWAALYKALSGHHLNTLDSAIWQLNEHDPQTRVVAAKKGSAAVSPPKPS